jgi:hypothetical protein
MKNLIFLISITFLFFLTSCEKENVLDAPITPQKVTSNLVENSDNELDAVGQIHNEVLTALFEGGTRNYFDPFLIDIEEILKLIDQYLQSNGSSGQVDKETVERMVRHIAKVVQEGKPITLATIDICQIFPPACDEVPMPYNPFPTSLPTYENPILTVDLELNYKNALIQINSIKEFEKTILNDSTIGEEDRKFYLAYASTYRHSTQFWVNAGNLDLYNVEKIDGASQPCGSCDIAKADAIGSAIGQAIGGEELGGIFGATASFYAFVAQFTD